MAHQLVHNVGLRRVQRRRVVSDVLHEQERRTTTGCVNAAQHQQIRSNARINPNRGKYGAVLL